MRKAEGYWLTYPSGFRTHVSKTQGLKLLNQQNVIETFPGCLELYEHANDPGHTIKGRVSGRGPTVIQRVRVSEGPGPLQRRSMAGNIRKR